MERCHQGLAPLEFLPYVEADLYQKIREDALGVQE